MNETRQPLPAEAVAALESGSKIEAIKIVRIARSVGLKEAKDIVEQFIEVSPGVKSRMAAQTESNGLRWLFIIIALGMIGYFIFSRG